MGLRTGSDLESGLAPGAVGLPPGAGGFAGWVAGGCCPAAGFAPGFVVSGAPVFV